MKKKNVRYERQAAKNLAVSDAAKLIWHPSEVETYYEKPQNSCCYFRKTVTVSDAVQRANLHLFADTHYVLYINGEEVGRGPCRSDPRWQYADAWDIAPFLRAGENLIAAEVMFYGYGNGKSVSRVPCLWFDGEIVCENGTCVAVASDETVRVCLSAAFDRNAPRINGCKGCMEFFDNRKAIPFQEADFDDSDWAFAKTRDRAMSPFWNVSERPIPNIGLHAVAVRAAIAGGIGKAARDEEKLYRKIQKEIAGIRTEHLYVLGSEGEINPVEPSDFSYVLADFEQVRAGYLTLDVVGYDGDIIDVVYAEALWDNKPVFDGVSYRPITRFILKDGENRLQTHFNYEAFRYVLLIFRNHVRANRILKIGMLERRLDHKEWSVFKTEDEALQKIWDISTHTLSLCMQDGFLDSPSREQQQWMGDGRFQAIMNYYMTGDCRMHEKLLLQIAQSQDREGMTASRYPDGNHNLPPIPSFCLQWICSFWDYYRFTGKTELIYELWDQIIKGIRWFSAFENEQGLLENVPYWNYLELAKNEEGKGPDIQRGGMLALLNLMYIEGLEAVQNLAYLLDDMETAVFFRRKCRKVKRIFRKLFWNAEFGAYCDCVVNGALSDSVSESVNAMAILLLHDKKEARVQSIIKTVFCAETKREKICVSSAYYMLPFYRAMQKAGRTDIALTETKRRYQDMLDAGATTTWEHWVLFEHLPNHGGIFQHSACHAWAAAPIVFIAEQLLGIDVLNQKGVKAKPRTDLIGGMEAEIYTPKGVVRIKEETV